MRTLITLISISFITSCAEKQPVPTPVMGIASLDTTAPQKASKPAPERAGKTATSATITLKAGPGLEITGKGTTATPFYFVNTAMGGAAFDSKPLMDSIAALRKAITPTNLQPLIDSITQLKAGIAALKDTIAAIRLSMGRMGGITQGAGVVDLKPLYDSLTVLNKRITSTPSVGTAVIDSLNAHRQQILRLQNVTTPIMLGPRLKFENNVLDLK